MSKRIKQPICLQLTRTEDDMKLWSIRTGNKDIAVVLNQIDRVEKRKSTISFLTVVVMEPKPRKKKK